jgi:PTS system nitrogen regulatory IIA component
MEKIIHLINDKLCVVNFKARNKEDCLRQFSRILAREVKDASEDIIYKSLFDREELGSTGFEDGIAIPHCKIKGLKEFALCIATSRKGVDFKSMDGKKSRLLFTVIGPEEKVTDHLKILAQISRITRNKKARRELLYAHTPVALKETFIRYSSGFGIRKREKGKEKLLMIILYENQFLEDIIQLFVHRGIPGASVMDSSGIKDQMSRIPLFSSFLNFLGEQSDTSKTIITIVQEDEVSEIVHEIEEIMGDLDTHRGAMVMALDIFFSKGSMEV